MELDLIVLDSSVMIDYFRKTDKPNSFFEKLFSLKKGFSISVITHYEIMIGNNDKQNKIWDLILNDIPMLDFHEHVCKKSIEVYKQLKKINKVIPFQDLAIASTALYYNYQFATINEKHFKNIKGLKLITPALFA